MMPAATELRHKTPGVIASRASAFLFLATVSGFFGFQILKAIRKPLYNIDAGYFALVAREVSDRFIYGLPKSSASTNVFAPDIGSGPVLILPGAAARAVFGAGADVMPLTAVVLFFILIVILTLVLIGLYDRNRVFCFMSAALVTLGVISRPSVDLVFEYMGEGPQLGLVLVGCALLARATRSSARDCALAGIALSLSLLAKQSSIFAVIGASVAWFAIRLLVARSGLVRDAAFFVIAGAVPVALFEAVKVANFGWSGYLGYISAVRVAFAERNTGSLNRLHDITTIVASAYAVGVTIAIFAITACVLMLPRLRNIDDRQVHLAIIMLGAIAVHIAYWAYFAPFSDRYLWLGMALMAFAICFPFLVLGRIAAGLLGCAFVILVASPAAIDRAVRAQMTDGDGSYRAEQDRALQIIAAHPGLPVTSFWWGWFYDIVYLLPPGREWFIAGDDVGRISSLDVLFVVNRIHWPSTSPVDDAVRHHCRDEMPEGSRFFAVFVCPSPLAVPGQTSGSGNGEKPARFGAHEEAAR